MSKAYEKRRGCGFRQVNKLYLMGEGLSVVCPSLPLEMKPCQCCGYQPRFYRDFQWISTDYINQLKEPTGLSCHPQCPVCYPGANPQERYGLMWVGPKFYTPEEFVKEAQEIGISKAIKQIPKGLEFGKTWVMVAHSEAIKDIENPDFQEKYNRWLTIELEKNPKAKEPQPPTLPAIFYAFRPTRVEMPIYESEATPERLAELEKKGITPVIIPDDGDAHARKTRKMGGRSNR